MTNPQLGWLVEEIEEADRESVNHLVEMGLVKIRKENSLDIDEYLLSMVQTMAHPNHTLVIRYGTPAYKSPERYIYFHENQIVDHIEKEDGIHQITANQDGNELLEILMTGIENSDHKDNSDKSFSISEKVLFAASAEYGKNNPQVGKEILVKESNLDSSLIQQLHDAFSNTQLNRSYVMIKNQGNRDSRRISGFGLLQGAEHFWMIQPIENKGKTIIQFNPTELEIIKDKILTTLPTENLK